MSTERIESLISRQAIDDFADLSAQVNKSIQVFEELIKKAAGLNQALGNAKSIKEISAAIDKLASEQAQLSKVTQGLADSHKKLSDAEKQRNDGLKKTEENTRRQNAIVTENITLNSKLANSLDAQIAQYNRYKISLDAIQTEIKNLASAYKNGTISLEQYQRGLNDLRLREEQQKAVLQSLGASIRQNVKDNVTAAGSIDQLKAKLALLLQTYDSLNAKQRAAPFGKELKRQIKEVTSELSKLEQATGRFQRNVGNYASAFGNFARNLGAIFGIVGSADVAKRIFAVNVELDQLTEGLKNVSGSSSEYERNVVFLKRITEQYGLALVDTTGAFKNFFAASTQSGISANKTRTIFEQVSKVATNLKLSQENVNGVLLAFGQVASKGKVQAEELRGQIGERIPGAFAVAAKAMGVTTIELNKMIEQGKVASDVFLPRFAAELERTFGKQDRIETLTAQINRFFNTLTEAVFSENFINFFTQIISGINSLLNGFQSAESKATKLAIATKRNAIEATTLADEYDKLSKKTNKTTEEKDQLLIIQGKLVDIYGDSIMRINEETGAYELNIDAVRDLIKQKLLLANSDASNISAKILKTQEDQNTLLQKKQNIVDQIGALTRKLGISEEEALRRSNERLRQGTATGTPGGSGGFNPVKGNAEVEKLAQLSRELRKNEQDAFNTEQRYQELRKSLEELGFTINDVNNLIASGDTKTDDTKIDPFSTKNKKSLKKPFFDEEIKAQIDQLKKISQAETFYDGIRINARREAAELELKLAKDKYDTDLANARDKYQKDVGNAQGNAQDLAIIQQQFYLDQKILDQKYAFDKKQIVENREFDIVQITRESKRRQKEIDKELDATFRTEQKDARDKQMSDLVKENEARVAMIETGRDIELTLLSEKFEKGLITQEKYAKEREKIERDASLSILQNQIRFAEAYLATQRALGEDTTKAEAELAAARKAFQELKTDSTIENEAEALKKLANVLQAVSKAYGEITNVVGGFIQARVDKQKNAIQEEIDANDKKTRAEIEAINASSLSQQEKADRIAVLNARNAAQKEQLERRQRLLDQQRARFEKAAGMGQIIINTAIAVTKALASLNIPLAIAVGALGAAQLAVAAATPIPKFKHGTKDAPGGPAIVGDGGRSELIVTPRGELIETPSIPTIMNVPKHSIIFPDSRKMTEKIISEKVSTNKVVQYHDVATLPGNNYTGIESKLDRINNTIKNKKELHIHRTRDGWKTISRTGGSMDEYLNRNL